MLDALAGNAPLLLLSVGLVLMLLEALSPGAHLIVIGVALVGAGLIGVLFPGPLNLFVLAALTLGFGIVAAYIYNEFDFYGGKGTAQTSDSDSLSGSTGYVTETVSTRGGEVKLEDGGFAPFYSARTTSGTIEEGEEVIVIDPGGGNVLTVESLGSIGDDEIDRALATESTDTEREATEPEAVDDDGTDAGTDTETTTGSSSSDFEGDDDDNGDGDRESDGKDEDSVDAETDTQPRSQSHSSSVLNESLSETDHS
ncbi:NfeD family protein [Natrialba sp. PRR66]|uniref:NfeD family protein n=1 Tax=Natrialba sp. PRR66 TaxID=3098146 RepID=UPI002B1D2E83|nr:NfeD family protein [Natrialba sp. PRR66]